LVLESRVRKFGNGKTQVRTLRIGSSLLKGKTTLSGSYVCLPVTPSLSGFKPNIVLHITGVFCAYLSLGCAGRLHDIVCRAVPEKKKVASVEKFCMG